MTVRDIDLKVSDERPLHGAGAGRTEGLHVEHGHPKRWLVRTQKQVGYEVRVVDGVFQPDRTDLIGGGSTGRDARLRRLVVVDGTIERLHGDRIRAYLHHHDVEHRLVVVPAEERVKHFGTVEHVVREIDAFGIARRSEPVIVVGGGVLLDIVGLAASLYRRGTPFVRIPTTLIGLVDAGVGAKTGVNFEGGKNRLGTYAPADLTLLDRSFLRTLPPRHVSNGLGEILKIALIKDRYLFELLERHGSTVLAERFQGLTPDSDAAALAVLDAATHNMLEELQPNLWEAELERCVDYGHTFSPTIEMHALPRLLHGEAVCVDMALTTHIACHRGLVTTEERDRILGVMSVLGLPSWDPAVTLEMLVTALHDTVLHRDGQQRLPLPVGIGAATFVNDVTTEDLAAAIAVQRRR